MTSWTATHRFVFLAMHLAYADGVLQEAERRSMAASAHRIGIAAGIAPESIEGMVRAAGSWYMDSVEAKSVHQDVQDAVASLGIFKDSIKRALLRELRELAKAADGVDEREHVLLESLRDAWNVDVVVNE